MADDKQDPYKTGNDNPYSSSGYGNNPSHYAGNQGYQPDSHTQAFGSQGYQPDAPTQIAGKPAYQPGTPAQYGGNQGNQPGTPAQYGANQGYQPGAPAQYGGNNGYQPGAPAQYGGNNGYQPDARTQISGYNGGYGSGPMMDAEEPCPKIHGWLLFFLYVFVGLGSILSIIIDFVDYDFSEPAFITACLIISDLGYLATGVFTILAFHKRDSDAVYLARIFIIACFIINLAALLISSDELSGKEVTTCIRSIIWCGVWFIFTFASQQIKERIPEYTRQFKIRDLALVGSIFLPIIALFLYGVIAGIQEEANANRDTELLSETVSTMGENQATDGRILITLPEDVKCDKEIGEEGLIIFNLENTAEGTYGTIVSEHDDTLDKATADDIYEGWMPEDATPSNSTLIVDKEYKKNGNTIWAKKLKIDFGDGEPVYWDFNVVADGKSDKFFVISTYSLHGNDPTWKQIFHGIEFLN